MVGAGEELPSVVVLAAAPAAVESEVAPAGAAPPFGVPGGPQLLPAAGAPFGGRAPPPEAAATPSNKGVLTGLHTLSSLPRPPPPPPPLPGAFFRRAHNANQMWRSPRNRAESGNVLRLHQLHMLNAQRCIGQHGVGEILRVDLPNEVQHLSRDRRHQLRIQNAQLRVGQRGDAEIHLTLRKVLTPLPASRSR